MRERIAQFIELAPRNKLVFIPGVEPHLHTVDVGYELSKRIQSKLASPHLPMIAEESLKAILAGGVATDPIIGKYISIVNWGILLEPSLKLNLVSLLDSYSKGQTLIVANSDKAPKTSHANQYEPPFPIGNLSPYIIH